MSTDAQEVKTCKHNDVGEREKEGKNHRATKFLNSFLVLFQHLLTYWRLLIKILSFLHTLLNLKAGHRKNGREGRPKKSALITCMPRTKRKFKSKKRRGKLIWRKREKEKSCKLSQREKIRKHETKNKHQTWLEKEGNCFRLVCLQSYLSCHPNEKWIQGLNCRQWSHEDCING